jgi:hypothetical protein
MAKPCRIANDWEGSRIILDEFKSGLNSRNPSCHSAKNCNFMCCLTGLRVPNLMADINERTENEVVLEKVRMRTFGPKREEETANRELDGVYITRY